MVVMQNPTGERELRAFVRSRGYVAEPILNTTAVLEGGDLAVVGYRLKGPRGTETVIAPTSGLYPLDQAELWCDAVDYASEKLARRVSRRN